MVKVAKKVGGKGSAKAPAAGAGDSKVGGDDDRRPEGPVEAHGGHARSLAKFVRRDVEALRSAKLSPADAEALESKAHALDEAQRRWLVLSDKQVAGQVAAARTPLIKGRDQLYLGLRTFAEDPDTQRRLDEIGEVENDDDLIEDAVRLVALAKRHAQELEGTDITPARVAEVNAALDGFRRAREGERSAPENGTAQAESRAMLVARRARNRAYWSLAELVRRVVKRGQYAFRDDPVKRKDYVLYRKANAPATKPATPKDPPAA